MNDLVVGMYVVRYNRHAGPTRSGRINGEPFVSVMEYDLAGQKFICRDWEIPVLTVDVFGKLVDENWFLADMGIVPYEGDDGLRHWNDQNYTLAV